MPDTNTVAWWACADSNCGPLLCQIRSLPDNTETNNGESTTYSEPIRPTVGTDAAAETELDHFGTTLLQVLGSSFFEPLDREAGRDYRTLYAERWGLVVTR